MKNVAIGKAKYRQHLIFLIILFAIINTICIFMKSSNVKQPNVNKYPNAVQVELSSNEDQMVLEEQKEGSFNLSTFIKTEAFKMSNTSQLIFYILAVHENRYDMYAIAYDTHNADNFDLEISKDTKELYFLMPEFATVYAATQSISSNVSEVEVIDGREAIKELQAGGGLKFRVFKSSMSEESINRFEFNLMSLNESMSIDSKSVIYGKYSVIISKY